MYRKKQEKCGIKSYPLRYIYHVEDGELDRYDVVRKKKS